MRVVVETTDLSSIFVDSECECEWHMSLHTNNERKVVRFVNSVLFDSEFD